MILLNNLVKGLGAVFARKHEIGHSEVPYMWFKGSEVLGSRVLPLVAGFWQPQRAVPYPPAFICHLTSDICLLLSNL